MSEKDILEKIEDAQMDMRRKQRALSIIPEYPEDESEEEKGHKIVLTTNLDDEYVRKTKSEHLSYCTSDRRALRVAL